MARSAPVVLEVLADGNTVLAERLARALRAELSEVEGVDVEFAAPETSRSEYTKGNAWVGDVALWLFLGRATKVTAQVVIETIRAWSERERNRTLRITKRAESIEITGRPDAAQERIIEKLMEDGGS